MTTEKPAKKTEKRGLGRGLSALLGDAQSAEAPVTASPAQKDAPAAPGIASVPVHRIHPNPDQPRRHFSDEELEELAASIRERGIIQPVILRPHPVKPDAYELVAGERRWRAAQRAQVHAIPAVIRELADRDVLELAIIENIQRVDLNPLEEARGYAQLAERFDYTQEALARTMGKSRSHIANSMRLLNLPDRVQSLVNSGKLTAGHARALVSAADPVALAEKVVAQGLTVRQVEQLAKRTDRPAGVRAPAVPPKDPDTRLLEGDLSAALGMQVTINHLGADGRGELRIRYKALEQLDDLCRKLVE